MSGQTLLGIDLGTSSAKVVLTDRAGRVLAHASRSYPVMRRHVAWAETDSSEWWQAIDAAVVDVASQHALAHLAGVGLSGQMHGVVLVDDQGFALRPAVLWLDARATNEAAEIANLSFDLRRRLANPVSPGMAGPILAWLDRHERRTVQSARAAIQPKDWVRQQVTGTIACEPSDASATLMFDALTENWNEDVTAALGIPRRLFPPILRHSGTPAGQLKPEVARSWGITHAVPVAAGAGDTAAAALGAGVLEPGVIQLTLGTGVQVITPALAPALGHLANSPVTHLYRSATPAGWYAMAAGLSGGAALAWVKDTLGASWDELYAAARRSPRLDDPVFVPHLSGERTPYFDTTLRGSWSGLGARHNRTDLLYSALEGVAFAIADVVEALIQVPCCGRNLRVAGGGITNPAWRDLLATVLDARLVAAAEPCASARGAALLAARAADLVTDVGLVQLATSDGPLVAEPDQRAESLVARRELYRRTVTAVPRGRVDGGSANQCRPQNVAPHMRPVRGVAVGVETDSGQSGVIHRAVT
jgi:xylulokinase